MPPPELPPCYACDVAEASGVADPMIAFTCDSCGGISHVHWSQFDAGLMPWDVVILRCHYCGRKSPPWTLLELAAIAAEGE